MLNEENKRSRDHVVIDHLNKQGCCGQVFHHLKECKSSLHFQKALLLYLGDFFTSNAIVL